VPFLSISAAAAAAVASHPQPHHSPRRIGTSARRGPSMAVSAAALDWLCRVWVSLLLVLFFHRSR